MGRWSVFLLLWRFAAAPRASASAAAAAYPYATDVFGVVEDPAGQAVEFYDFAYIGVRTVDSEYFENHRYTADALRLAVDYVNTRRTPHKGVNINSVRKYLRLTMRSTAGSDASFESQQAQCVALAKATVRSQAAQVVLSPPSSDFARNTTPIIAAARLVTLATQVSAPDIYEDNALIYAGLSAASSRFRAPVELAVRRGARQFVYVSMRTKTINDELADSIREGINATNVTHVRFRNQDLSYFDEDYNMNATALVANLTEVYDAPYSVGERGVDVLVVGFSGEPFAELFYALRTAALDVGMLLMSSASYDAATWALTAGLAGVTAGPSDHLYIVSTPQWLSEQETKDASLTGWTSAEYAAEYKKMFLYSPDYHSAAAHTDVALLVAALERSPNGSACSVSAFFRGLAARGESIPGLLDTTLDADTGQQTTNYLAGHDARHRHGPSLRRAFVGAAALRGRRAVPQRRRLRRRGRVRLRRPGQRQRRGCGARQGDLHRRLRGWLLPRQPHGLRARARGLEAAAGV